MGIVDLSLLTSTGTLFLMMLVGFIAGKKHLLTSEVSNSIIAVLIDVIIPANTLSGFLTPYDTDKAHGMWLSLIMAVTFYVIAILAGIILIPSSRPGYAVERVCLAFQNIGFVAIPLAQTMFGSEGVIYATMFRIMFILTFYTYGVAILEGEFSLSGLKKELFTPVFGAALTGFTVFLFRLHPPGLIADAVSGIGSCATPMAMLICGGIVARSDMKAVLKKWRTYFICAMRLVVLPLVILCICKLFSLPEKVAVVSIICSGASIGTMPIFYSEKLNRDSAYASGMFGITTLLCLVTIPLMERIYAVIG